MRKRHMIYWKMIKRYEQVVQKDTPPPRGNESASTQFKSRAPATAAERGAPGTQTRWPG